MKQKNIKPFSRLDDLLSPANNKLIHITLNRRKRSLKKFVLKEGFFLFCVWVGAGKEHYI